MTPFFDHIPLVLTPLTPIHIGCGEDFEPTNYVIDDGVLYHFDPVRVSLGKQDRDALLAAVDRRGDEAIRDLQRYFYTRRERYAGVARAAVAVASGVAEQYQRRIGQVAQHESGGRRVTNQLEIERTAHHPHTGVAYIPGSSVKGAIRTAWLDHLNRGKGALRDERAQDIEKRLLGSRAGFHADPFRLIRLADANGADVESKVVFATNHKKRLVHDREGRPVEAKGPATRREVIVGGQHRVLSSELRLDTLPGINAGSRTPDPENRIPGFVELAAACNRYYVGRLEALLAVLEGRGFAEQDWLAAAKTLLRDFKPHLDSGRAMLLRVGRHSGAESVTLDGVRSIRIMRGRGQSAEWSPDGAKTLWLAAERESDRSGMLPFGWLIVEPATNAPLEALARWCSTQPKSRMAEIRARLRETHERAAVEADRQRQLEVERQVREAAAVAEQAEREAARDRLSEQGRLIDDFVRGCRSKVEVNRRDPFNPGSGLYAQALRLSKSALAADSPWSPLDRSDLAQALSEWLPQVIDKLDRPAEWKEARKKLQLAVLGGQ